MKKLIFFAVMLFGFITSCYKNDTAIKPEELQLRSPDNKIRLGNSASELVNEIIKTTGSKDILSIEKIEHNKIKKGYYSIVTYKKKDGTIANMIFSSFPLGLITNKFIFHPLNSGNEASMAVNACYKFWCTSAGNCTSCQVFIEDPFGSPTMRCSCDECHLHGQQVLCPE